MSTSVETIAERAAPHRDLGVPPSRDAAGRRPRAAGLAAAILLHGAVIALVLVKLPAAEPAREPPAIPVELVVVPEAKPKPKPVPVEQPKPPAQAQPFRESGGDPDKTPGHVAEAEAPKKAEPVPPPAEAPAPQQAAPALEGELPPPPLPVPPPPQPPQPQRAKPLLAALPPLHRPSAESATPRPPSESSLTGEGGGDRYLNKVRDIIISNLIYPGAARAGDIAGVARFELVIDRQGHLLELRLARSSGAEVLDRAGREAVELSAPFGPPPPDVIGDQIGLLLTLYIGPDAPGTR